MFVLYVFYGLRFIFLFYFLLLTLLYEFCMVLLVLYIFILYSVVIWYRVVLFSFILCVGVHCTRSAYLRWSLQDHKIMCPFCYKRLRAHLLITGWEILLARSGPILSRLFDYIVFELDDRESLQKTAGWRTLTFPAPVVQITRVLDRAV